MPQRSNRALGTPAASQVNLRCSFACQILDLHVVYRRKVLHLVSQLEIDRLSGVKQWNQ